MRTGPVLHFLRQFSIVTRINSVRKAAPLFTTPWALARAELIARETEAREWHLKTGEAIWLRPRTTDLQSLVEVYRQRLYALPERTRVLLDTIPTVIDAGANIGLFTLFLCNTHPSVRVKAFEPDDGNAEIARRNLAGLINAGRVELRQAAVGAGHGELRFARSMGMNSRAAIAGDRDVVIVPQIDLLDLTSGTGLLKLDVEGAEWEIMRDPRWSLRAPHSLVLEWHGLRADGQEADAQNEIVRLAQQGDLEVEPDPFVADPPLVGGFWAWRPSS